MKKIKRLIFLLFAALLIFSCASINTSIKNTPGIQTNQKEEIEKCEYIFVNNSFYGVVFIVLEPMSSRDVHKTVLWPKWICETENNSGKKWKEVLYLDDDGYLITVCLVDSRNKEPQALEQIIMEPEKNSDGCMFEIHFTDPITDNNSCKTPEERSKEWIQ